MAAKKKKIAPAYLFTLTAIMMLTFFNPGCQHTREGAFYEKKMTAPIEKIVLLGFKPAMPQGRSPAMVRSPLSGAVFMAESVPRDVAARMTENLFERILGYGDYDVIGPSQAKGVFENLVSLYSGVSDRKIFGEIGAAFAADAVLVGFIYRWQEREGKNYSVRRPASVAFDLYLLEPKDGAVLWGAKFEKTQQSLSENIFDFSTFLKGKGKWMTAAGLADLGLNEMLNESPLKKKVRSNN